MFRLLLQITPENLAQRQSAVICRVAAIAERPGRRRESFPVPGLSKVSHLQQSIIGTDAQIIGLY
jgi:hypothetical protein